MLVSAFDLSYPVCLRHSRIPCNSCVWLSDVRDDKGQSLLDLLDKALRRLYDGDCVDVALYLMSRGCGGDEDKAKLLCRACSRGKLGVVKELIEYYKVDPCKSE